jgi:hypothetical protein
VGLFDFLKKQRRMRDLNDRMRALDDRFRSTPASADDNLLLPHQIKDLPELVVKAALQDIEIIFVWELSDEILPEDQRKVPNLLMEFRNDPQLAMVHAVGTCHAWIRATMLKEALETWEGGIHSYRDLFRALQRLGYGVKRVTYIAF